MNKKTDLVKNIMKVAEHYKNGELHAIGAMTDIGILLDDYEKSKAENLPIPDVSNCAIWKPTMCLRWCETDIYDYGYERNQMVLQQKWQNSEGKEEWKEIEVYKR